MAMACFRLFTCPPFPAFPDRKVPFLRRRIALLTDLPALLPYLAIISSRNSVHQSVQLERLTRSSSLPGLFALLLIIVESLSKTLHSLRRRFKKRLSPGIRDLLHVLTGVPCHVIQQILDFLHVQPWVLFPKRLHLTTSNI